jgi:hypothetical protein
VQRSRCLPLYLAPDEYARLDRAASAEEREPAQQARWVLKQWLTQVEHQGHRTDPTPRPEEQPLVRA